MRLYKFLSKKYAFMVLDNRRLKISRLHELNDPFETRSLALTSRIARVSHAGLLADISERFGVVSFCRAWTNPVIWSHYADEHRGICLGFEAPNDQMGMGVEYVRKRDPYPEDADQLHDNGVALVARILRAKHIDWAYENEIRMFTDLRESINGLYFVNFGPDLILRDVIVGARSSTCKRELEARLKNDLSSVRVTKAALSHDAFEIVADPDPDALRNHDDLRFFSDPVRRFVPAGSKREILETYGPKRTR